MNFRLFLQESDLKRLVRPAICNLEPGTKTELFWLRISMDRISDSDSEDAGSIPAGATNKADIKRQAGLNQVSCSG
jgi:hypothetical protein